MQFHLPKRVPSQEASGYQIGFLQLGRRPRWAPLVGIGGHNLKQDRKPGKASQGQLVLTLPPLQSLHRYHYLCHGGSKF